MIVYSPFGPLRRKTLIESYRREFMALGFQKATEDRIFGELTRP